MWYVGGRGNLKGFLFQFSLLIGIGLSSCGKLPDYQVLSTQDAFVADAEVNPNIDLLFVIDNSGSMSRDQQVLADSFNSFISNFTDKNLQYRIGVISTDTCRYNTSDCGIAHWSATKTNPSYPSVTTQYKYGGIFNNGIGGLMTRYDVDGVFYPNGQSVVSPADPLKFLSWDSDPDPAVAKSLTISRFTNNAKIGTTGSGSEAPLSAVAAALDRANAYNGTSNIIDVNYNDGFFRAGAFTAIIIVTDEDEGYGWAGTPTRPATSGSNQWYLSGRSAEASSGDVEEGTGVGNANSADVNTRIGQFLSSLEGLKGASLDNFLLSVVAVPKSATSCVINSVAETADNYEPAWVLDRVVNDVNSTYGTLGSGKPKATFTDICSDFSGSLSDIASDIVEANARYALDQAPANPAEITVFVNGSVVPRNTTNGWEYDSVNNAIQFYGTAVPSVGDSVSIDYVPGAPI